MTQDRSADLRPDAVLRYAEHDDAIIDLHLPALANGTLVVLVHGGFWKHLYDRRHTRALARALAEAGYLVATPEYRRVGGGGGWPTTADDLATAYDALPGLLGELGISCERTVTIGHSAGGHLVLWLASRTLTRPPDRTIALAPVCDLVRARELDLGSGAVEAFLGGAPVSAADPNTLLVLEPAGEVLIVHGDLDDEVPIELSRGFATAHPWAGLTELPGTGHYEFLDPTTDAWATAVALLS